MENACVRTAHTLHAGCYTTCFPCRTLNPQQPPGPLSPWERVRERATSRKACIWSVRVLGKVAEIWRMPSPQPSPTGEGVGCSGFKRYRSSEKRMPEISTAGIFQVAFITRQMEQTPRAFFQTTFEPVGSNCIFHPVGQKYKNSNQDVWIPFSAK